MNAKDFIQGYIECALWCGIIAEDGADGEEGSEDELTSAARETLRSDALAFLWSNRHALRRSGLSAARAGHDFWLTRNHHGAGFWDEGLGELGEKLTDAAHPYGEAYLYRGDDGNLYHN